MTTSASSSTAAAGPSTGNVAGPSTNPALEANYFKRLHPRKYLSRFLEEGYRPDARKVDAWRDLAINVGSVSTANGSSLVRLGDTTIVCGIKAETAEPDWDRPDEGFVVPNLDLPAISSPQFKPGPPTDEAQVFSQQLYELITSSGVLPLSSLSIHSGKSAWVLYIDAVCINYDGNAFDAVVLAVMAALRNTRLPLAKYDEESGQTICSRSETRELQIDSMPLSCTFGLYDSKYLLPDPTAFELPLCSTTITVALETLSSSTDDPTAKIRLIRQLGMGGIPNAVGGPMGGMEVLGECLRLAGARVKELRAMIQ